MFYFIINKKSQNIILLKYFFIFFFIYIYLFIINSKKILYNKIRIGVINMPNDQNVGNILVKFSLSKKLKEFGFDPIMITKNWYGVNISFLNRTVKLKIIKENFYELNKNDFDILILNSDQTWGNYEKQYLYEYAFLKFSENWTIPKFIYGASMGSDNWFYTEKDEKIGKHLLKSFSGISFREIGLVKLAEKHLNIKPIFVLDPTLIIDKNYYLDEIRGFNRNFDFNKKYLFVYILDKNILIEKFINETIQIYNYSIN